MHQGRRSLAEILTLPVRLGPETAVAIVRQLCRMPSGALMPVEAVAPRVVPEHVWLHSDGNVRLSPGVVPVVRDLGALLEQLLVEGRQNGVAADPGQRARIPGGLVLLTARATGQIDAQPLVSLEAFAAALERFDAPHPQEALRALFAAAAEQMRSAWPVSATLEQPALVQGSRDELEDLEYQAPLAVGTLTGGRLARQERVRSWPRPRTWAALALASAAAGATTAVVVPVRRGNEVRVRETTDVLIAPPSAVTPAPSEPVRTPTSPPSANRSAAHKPPAPSSLPGDGLQDGRASTAAGSATRDRQRSPFDANPHVAARGEPKLLLDRNEVAADAIYSPSFAGDGAAFFFQAQSPGGSALKRAERGDSGDLHIVTIVDDAAKNYHVKLSPDGRSVAFDSDRDGVRGVYLARADGRDVRRVSGGGYAAVPTWSPDGRRLAFLRAEEDRPRVWNLWLLDLGTGETTRLTSHRYGQVWGGAWFPDGRRIAYSHEDRLIVLELSSGGSMSYPTPRPGHLVRTPAVSPDGRSIMFQVYRDGGWLLDVESGSMQRVLDDPSAEEFTWAPDGRRVAFHSRRAGGWGLWMMAAR